MNHKTGPAQPNFQSLNYIFAALAVAAMAGLLLLFRQTLNTSTVALLFLIPVLLSTTLWGLGPGILSAVLTFLSYNFLFLPPYNTFLVHESQDILALGIFLLVAVLISQLVGRARTGLSAARAREHEARRMYELSIALAGVSDLRGIASVIAQKTLETFPTAVVHISVLPLEEEHPFTVDAGGGVQAADATLFIPLNTVRAALGEIHLWRGGGPFSQEEERLLRAFAAQGALALERAALAHAQNRAQVLEESDKMKSALLSSVSHEFRTPLVTIKAATTSLLDGQVDWDSEARSELLTAVDEEADHLNYLIGNLLNMTRIESGALKPNRQWNLLTEIVDGVVVRMHRLLDNYTLETDIAEDLPLVPVDYMQIEQVFTNLLSNSAKYAPAGSKITVKAGTTLSDLNQPAVLVQITNQGPNVAPEHLDRIFDKFFRVTDADKITGTGLGLSICKGIIEAHGGRIWAENLEQGFSFKFTLPLSLDGMPPPKVRSEEE